ncbi:MAG: hypothetical protein AB7P01_01245 [Bacteroidia bacterium]
MLANFNTPAQLSGRIIVNVTTSFNNYDMTKPKRKISKTPQKRIKVQLDYKTIITINRMESLKLWLERYPQAKVLA